MAVVQSPQTGAEVTAEGESLERFIAAGWAVIEPSTLDANEETDTASGGASLELNDDAQSATPSGVQTGSDGNAEPNSEDSGDLSNMDEPELRAFADARQISLGKLKNVDKIRERISEAIAEQA